jgi:hypothetical protein
LEILQAGLPEDVSLRYIGGDVLTMLGQSSDQYWQYSVTLPDTPMVDFAFIVQTGNYRGTMIVIRQ